MRALTPVHVDAEAGPFAFEKYVPVPRDPERSRDICIDFQYGRCTEADCPYRHTRVADQQALQRADSEVCKYWLRGLCTEGHNCLFLHDYVKEKVPMCIYFQKFGECGNPECVFRHERQTTAAICAAYLRGFCANGPDCHLRHIQQAPCLDYLRGFCPRGPECPEAHPSMDFYDEESVRARVRAALIERTDMRKLWSYERSTLLKPSIVCDRCRDPGHIAPNCPNGHGGGEVLAIMKEIQEPGAPPVKDGCYSCGGLDHIARNCPKRMRTMHGARYE